MVLEDRKSDLNWSPETHGFFSPKLGMLFFTFFHHDQPILDPLNIRGPWGKSAIHQVNWLLQQRRGSVTITDLTRREDVTEVAGGGGDVASTCFVIRYTYVYLSIRSHSHLTIVSIVIYTIFPNALVFLFFLGTLFWTNTRPWSFSRLSWKLVRHVSILERISSTSWISAVYILWLFDLKTASASTRGVTW